MEHGHESVCSRQHRLHQPINFLCTDMNVRVAIRLCAFLCRSHAVARNGLKSPSTVPYPFQLPHVETRDNSRNFTCFPTCPFVSHGPAIVCVISTLKSWSVPSCRVSCCPATTYCVCVCSPACFLAALCHVLLRHGMPVKPQHGRYFQGATTLLMT